MTNKDRYPQHLMDMRRRLSEAQTSLHQIRMVRPLRRSELAEQRNIKAMLAKLEDIEALFEAMKAETLRLAGQAALVASNPEVGVVSYFEILRDWMYTEISAVSPTETGAAAIAMSAFDIAIDAAKEGVNEYRGGGSDLLNRLLSNRRPGRS